jgi:hypothetical protein
VNTARNRAAEETSYNRLLSYMGNQQIRVRNIGLTLSKSPFSFLSCMAFSIPASEKRLIIFQNEFIKKDERKYLWEGDQLFRAVSAPALFCSFKNFFNVNKSCSELAVSRKPERAIDNEFLFTFILPARTAWPPFLE